MTEKRFKYLFNRLGMQFICYDDKEVLLGTFADKDGVKHITDLLNELSDENEQLKEERNYFERKKCEYFNKYNKKHLDNIQLKEENEQLKARIEYLERKIQRERVSYQKQHEKWEKELKE